MLKNKIKIKIKISIRNSLLFFFFMLFLLQKWTFFHQLSIRNFIFFFFFVLGKMWFEKLVFLQIPYRKLDKKNFQKSTTKCSFSLSSSNLLNGLYRMKKRIVYLNIIQKQSYEILRQNIGNHKRHRV